MLLFYLLLDHPFPALPQHRCSVLHYSCLSHRTVTTPALLTSPHNLGITQWLLKIFGRYQCCPSQISSLFQDGICPGPEVRSNYSSKGTLFQSIYLYFYPCFNIHLIYVSSPKYLWPQLRVWEQRRCLGFWYLSVICTKNVTNTKQWVEVLFFSLLSWSFFLTHGFIQ